MVTWKRGLDEIIDVCSGAVQKCVRDVRAGFRGDCGNVMRDVMKFTGRGERGAGRMVRW